MAESDCCAKLAVQRGQKKERKAKAASSSYYFLEFFPSMPVPLCELVLLAP